MKALALEHFGNSYILKHNVQIPNLEKGLMLVNVKMAGFCHTDLLVHEVGLSIPEYMRLFNTYRERTMAHCL